MGFLEQLFFHPVAGSFGLLSLIAINIWAVRLIRTYQRETREEYRARLRDAVMELDHQKSRNIRLELKIQTMEHLAKE